MNDALDFIKNMLVCCCLMATLCSTCRQEQANDKLTAEINTLKCVSDNISECVYVPQENEENNEK